MLDPILTRIEQLERNTLDGSVVQPFDPVAVLASQSFLRISGLADFWNHSDTDFNQYMHDLVVSTHSQQTTFLTFVLTGTPESTALYFALGTPEMTQNIVEGILPGVVLEVDPVSLKPKVYRELAHELSASMPFYGILSGIPDPKQKAYATHNRPGQQRQTGQAQPFQPPQSATRSSTHLERVIRGMSNATWTYIVRAYPRPRTTIGIERVEIIDQLAQVMAQVKGQIQRNTQSGQTLTASKNTSYTETMSGEIVNYRAQYLVQLLEKELQRLEQAIAVGQWTVDVRYGAQTRHDALRLSALLLGTLSGPESRPQPLRAIRSESRLDALTSDECKTYLTSAEVGNLIQFPREEFPGYAIHDFASFDVDFQGSSPRHVPLGHIQQQNRELPTTYKINLTDLTRHAVVVGVTGSGKTTTVLNLISQSIKEGVPFLIIEPVKTEYRALRRALRSHADVRIYTLGHELIAPFRLNPFEFETDDTPGSGSLLNHIDFLKAVFNAAFALYPPMPYILEMALHEIYEARGWDLATGQNTRIPESEWTKRHLYPLFPTLSDLYERVEVVTNRLKYFAELDQNIKAALKARIGSLRIGAKGFMLDTPRGIPMADLLSQPTVLEMENIGNDDEKTFLMGIFLSRLYEYRRLQASTGTLPTGLQHLLVFEEAHRLLKDTQTQVSADQANPRAQAIETFTNMLSEIRGYGQGVIVAEQIPAKLAPDVLKNTNLKIVHRLVAQDDRVSIGQTMNLTPEQLQHLGTLAPGRAAIYAEGADHAYLVRMENYKTAHALVTPTDSELQKESHSYASVEFALPVPHMNRYGIRYTHFHGPDMALYQLANTIIELPEYKVWWANTLLCVLFERARLPIFLARLPQIISLHVQDQPWQRLEALRVMVLVRSCSQQLHARGAEVGWSYPFIEDLRHRLTQGLLTLAQTGELTLANADLTYFARKYLQRMERKQGPFPACLHCPHICHYRTEVSRIITQQDIKAIHTLLVQVMTTTPAPYNYQPVIDKLKRLGLLWFEGEHPLIPEVAFCTLLVAMHTSGAVDTRQQAFSGEKIAQQLF